MMLSVRMLRTSVSKTIEQLKRTFYALFTPVMFKVSYIQATLELHRYLGVTLIILSYSLLQCRAGRDDGVRVRSDTGTIKYLFWASD